MTAEHTQTTRKGVYYVRADVADSGLQSRITKARLSELSLSGHLKSGQKFSKLQK